MGRYSQWIFLVSILVMITLLVACDPPARALTDCNEILELPLRSLLVGTLTKAEAKAWLRSQLPADVPIEPGDSSIAWSVDRNDFVMRFDGQGKLSRIVKNHSRVPRLEDALPFAKHPNGGAPMLQDVLRCFGAPDAYEAVRGMHEFSYFALNLWYPKLGLAYSHNPFAGVPPSLAELGMHTLAIYAPAQSAQALIEREWSVQTKTETDKRMLTHHLKPWPGSLERIVVDDCSQEPARCGSASALRGVD
jgi:hypothetical protein